MKNDIQVLAIGNAFELVCQNTMHYSKLSELTRVDERHFGQKATFWETTYGLPHVVICTVAPSRCVLERTYGCDLPWPHFVEPKRESSSICCDLLADTTATNNLLSALDCNKRIFLAPYVHTKHVEHLAAFLRQAGYTLLGYREQSDLVAQLWNKMGAHELVFRPIELLREHRPRVLVAQSASELWDALLHFFRSGIGKAVVKSSAAVGGAGVFFVNSDTANLKMPLEELLIGTGQNEVDRSLPFVIEEHVEWDVSPTVDIELSETGLVRIVGIALQRLYDNRYYTGFYASDTFKDSWWFKKVEQLAIRVGQQLFSLGYLGPANVDFVVSFAEHRVTLIEVNPRRSALIDGFSLKKIKYGSRQGMSISVADYVNISECFSILDDAFLAQWENNQLFASVLPVADGGFSSQFRWAGIWAAGVGLVDSEDILAETVGRLQDPVRDEIGVTQPESRMFSRIIMQSSIMAGIIASNAELI